MRTPGFLEGIGVALAACIAAGVLQGVLGPLLGSGSALRLLLAGTGLAYVLYLLRRAPERCGRVTAVVSWCVIAAIAAFVPLPLSLFVLLHLGLAWLLRSLYFHSSLLSALLDLGLVAFGLGAALSALLHTGSLLLAFWCFFLVQAFFVAIPASFARRPVAACAGPDRFQHAHRAAETALRRLSSIH